MTYYQGRFFKTFRDVKQKLHVLKSRVKTKIYENLETDFFI